MPEKIRKAFKSDFKIVADFFAEKRLGRYNPKEHPEAICHVEAVLNLLQVFTNDETYVKIEKTVAERAKAGEVITMCTFAEEMTNKGIEIGEEQGIRIGEARGIAREKISVARNHKDRLFRMIFREKKELLSLYNAVNGTSYTNTEELEIVTLENAIYMNMKNDLAFIMDSYLNLYEHQSAYSPNMPLRDLFYIAKELQGQVNHRDLYRNTLIKIPTPRFLVFYNGSEEQAEKKYLRLSDAFQKSMDDPDLELVVTMLNINLGKNRKLLEQCQTLKEYAIYVKKVRTYAKSMKVEEAVDRAVTECINEGILQEFLLQNRKEAVEMSIFEYDEEAVFEIVRKDEYEKGHQEGVIAGKAEDILELLEDIGTIPEEVREKITGEIDLEILKKWHKLAAKSESIDEFVSKM